MSRFELIILAAILGLISFSDRKKGFYICLAFGFAQEILRKIIPGQPVYLSAMVMVFVVITYAGIWAQNPWASLRRIHSWSPILEKPLNLFLGLVMIQAVAAFIRTQSIVIPVIGLLAYLTPIPALLLAYHHAKSASDIKRVLILYISCAALMSTGIYLDFFGFKSTLLDPVGQPILWYPTTGGVRRLIPGFYRTASVAGWHTAAAACMTLLLAVTSNRKIFKFIAATIFLFLSGAVILTARRKFLVEISLFILIYIILVQWFRRESIRVIGFLLTVGVVAIVFVSQSEFASERGIEAIAPYLIRTQSLISSDSSGKFDTIPDRVVTILSMTRYVIHRNGFFGSGAGTGSQGAQHYGGGARITGGSAEGGLGKVLAELGVPGLILFLLLLLGLARYLLKIVKYVSDKGFFIRHFCLGFIAFFIANGAMYTIAHQVFGDVFVLVILGWLLGFIMATPHIGEKTVYQTQTRKMDGPEGAMNRPIFTAKTGRP